MDADALPLRQERARLGFPARAVDAMHGFHLWFWYRGGFAAEAKNRDYAWRCKNRQPLQKVEAAEHVTREEWLIRVNNAVRPASARPVSRKIRLIAFARQARGGNSFPAKARVNGVPWKWRSRRLRDCLRRNPLGFVS